MVDAILLSADTGAAWVFSITLELVIIAVLTGSDFTVSSHLAHLFQDSLALE